MVVLVPGGTGAQESAVQPVPVEQPAEEELFFAGAETDPDPATDEELTAFGFGDLIRMIVVLIAVVGAIYGAVALLKRLNRGAVEDSSVIRVLASKTIAGGKSVHAIQVGQKVYLLGAGDDSLGLIAEVSDQESVQELQLAHSATAAAEGSAGEGSFGARLARLFAGTGGEGTNGANGVEFLQRQRERLRSLR